MGSLVLTCPMCCGETFNSPRLLSDHLLTMTNLYCPIGCSFRSETIQQLIQHLDECGQEEDVTLRTDSSDLNENDILMNSNVEEISDSFLVNNEGIMIMDGSHAIEVDENGEFKVIQNPDIKNEMSQERINNTLDENEKTNDEFIDENEENNLENSQVLSIPETESILETDDVDNNDVKSGINLFQDDSVEFLEDEQNLIEMDQQEMIEETPTDEVQLDETGYYSCSTCGVSFEAIMVNQHIEEFHSGQQIVLETDDINEETEMIIPEEPEQEPEPEPVVTKQRHRQTLNTIRTEECVDSEGRFYTRKVVQIEPFWDRTNTAVKNNQKQTSMIEKFFSNTEGVKTRSNNETIDESTSLQRPYRCQQCLQIFTRSGEFRIHVCLNGKNQCQLCDKAFATVKALQIHLKDHTIEKEPSIFKCTICGTEFTSHKSLRLHARMHAPVRTRHVEAPAGTSDLCFECTVCGKTLSVSYRATHMALHTSDAVTCTVCNRKFETSESLTMHLAIHQELGITKNQITNEQVDPLSLSPNSPAPFSSTGTTGTSTSTSTIVSTPLPPDPSKPYQCQHCHKRFTRPHEKVKHERIHTGEKPHICEVCGKKFRVSYCLTLHMRTHTGHRPYECKICKKKFKASSVYNHHVLTHGDARAYKCDYCEKTFKTRVQLAGHKNSHTKPFHCTECSRPFASLYAARNHIETHKKDNNLKFTCDICGASYGRAFALNDHMKSHGCSTDAESPLPSTPLPEAAREEEVVQEYIMNEEITEEELINESSVLNEENTLN